MNEKVSGEEVKQVLLAALRGELPIYAVNASWDEVYSGNMTFKVGDWRIMVFNDCLEFDYVARAESPDGRVAVYTAGDDSDWTLEENPEYLMSISEAAAVEAMLESAPVLKEGTHE